MKILFVAHRYFPIVGGTEFFVRFMAEELLKRNHKITVLADFHKGNQNGILVTSNKFELVKEYDFIIVHGGECSLQDYVHSKSYILTKLFRKKIIYMIIKPSDNANCLKSLENSTFLTYSTSFDKKYIYDHGYAHKAVRVRHGIPLFESVGKPGFKKKFGIRTKYMYLSSGGYWPNKGIDELYQAFKEIKLNDATLIFTGYDMYHLAPPEIPNIKVLKDISRQDVLNGMHESDLYIMNSTSEGFGMVLLEAMVNRCPWISRDIAGAHDLSKYGTTYDSYAKLKYLLKNYKKDTKLINQAFDYTKHNYLIENTVNDIEKILFNKF
jgi:glycosyltransferase involved in cell wall biosynthesis